MPLLDWFVAGNNSVNAVIFRNNKKEVSLDISSVSERYNYTVRLESISTPEESNSSYIEYRGEYKRNDGYIGQCFCTIFFMKEDGMFLLNGSWNEQGSDFKWILDNTY